MKLKADVQLYKFIWRKYRGLILLSMLVLILIVVFSFLTLQRRKTLTAELQQLQAQLNEQKLRLEINSSAADKLIENNESLRRFLPDEFDLYNLLDIIDAIGEKTKFKIEGYSILQQDNPSGILVKKGIAIKGSGTFEQFLGFLKEYKYITGQMISISSVSLTGKDRVFTQLAIDIFAYKPNVNLQNIPVIQGLDATDNRLLEIIALHTAEEQKKMVTDDYENKSNPFR